MKRVVTPLVIYFALLIIMFVLAQIVFRKKIWKPTVKQVNKAEEMIKKAEDATNKAEKASRELEQKLKQIESSPDKKGSPSE